MGPILGFFFVVFQMLQFVIMFICDKFFYPVEIIDYKRNFIDTPYF